MSNDNSNGYRLESFVEQIYKRMGYDDVRVHHTIKTMSGKNDCQFDVTFLGWFTRKFVECKFREDGSLVSYEEVTKFAGDLDLVNVPRQRGTMITNSHYSPRGIEFAQINGITLIDREKLKEMYFDSLGFFEQLKKACGKINLEEEIRKMKVRE